MGRVFQTGVERVLFLFLNDFIEQFPMINPGVPIKRAHTPHIEPLHPDHHTAADYLRQFDLLVLNFISRGNFVILPDYGITLRFTDGSGIKNLTCSPLFST